MNLPTVHRTRPAAPRIRDNKTPEERKFYSSQAWRRLSEQHRRAEPLCRDCESRGIVKLGKVTDHIVPVREGGDPWDESNLQTLCHPCHERKSAIEGRGRGPELTRL